jgi:hypothetical protein
VRLAMGLTLLAATGCATPPSQPISTQATNNKAFQVEQLFEYDGCTLYRFEDAGQTRYFAKCSAPTSTVSWQENCGKNCFRDVSISAAAVPFTPRAEPASLSER